MFTQFKISRIVIISLIISITGASVYAQDLDMEENPSDNLQVILRMDQEVLEDNQCWRGKIFFKNTGKTNLVMEYCPGIKVHLKDGKGEEGDCFYYIGSGISPGNSRKKAFMTITPGEEREAGWFTGKQSHGMVLSLEYPNMVGAAWRMKPDRVYSLYVTVEGNTSNKDDWTGKADSNTVYVKTISSKVDAPVRGGLQMILSLTVSESGKYEPFNHAVGQLRLKNTTDEPIIFDTQGKFKTWILDENKKAMPGVPSYLTYPSNQPKYRFKTIQPGETWFWSMKFSCTSTQDHHRLLKGDKIYYAPAGKWTVYVVYQCCEEESKEQGIKGIWTGDIKSNTCTFTVPEVNEGKDDNPKVEVIVPGESFKFPKEWLVKACISTVIALREYEYYEVPLSRTKELPKMEAEAVLIGEYFAYFKLKDGTLIFIGAGFGKMEKILKNMEEGKTYMLPDIFKDIHTVPPRKTKGNKEMVIDEVMDSVRQESFTFPSEWKQKLDIADPGFTKNEFYEIPEGYISKLPRMRAKAVIVYPCSVYFTIKGGIIIRIGSPVSDLVGLFKTLKEGETYVLPDIVNEYRKKAEKIK